MAPCQATMASDEPVSLSPGSPATLVKITLEHSMEGDAVQKVIVNDSVPLVAISSGDSLYSQDSFCRICHEGGAVEELLSPCLCSGSLSSVHRSCVERWLAVSNSSRCELCHFEFALERLPKTLTEWLCTPSMRPHRRTLCGDALCFTLITPLASLSGWLCIRGAADLYRSNSLESMGLLVLTIALLGIYLFWTTVSLRYHIHLFETWRKTNQRVRLHIPPGDGLPRGLMQRSPSPASKDTCKEAVV